jgi:hypothetical protein
VTAEPLVSSVTVESDVPEGERSAIKSLFAHYGLDVEVAATGQRDPETLSWLIQIAVIGPLPAFFASFGAAFGPSEGNDAYPLAKEWLEKLLQIRESGGGQGSIEIRDENGTSLLLRSGIAGEALDALAVLEWETVKGDPLTWDQGAHRWQSPPEP